MSAPEAAGTSLIRNLSQKINKKNPLYRSGARFAEDIPDSFETHSTPPVNSAPVTEESNNSKRKFMPKWVSRLGSKEASKTSLTDSAQVAKPSLRERLKLKSPFKKSNVASPLSSTVSKSGSKSNGTAVSPYLDSTVNCSTINLRTSKLPSPTPVGKETSASSSVLRGTRKLNSSPNKSPNASSSSVKGQDEVSKHIAEFMRTQEALLNTPSAKPTSPPWLRSLESRQSTIVNKAEETQKSLQPPFDEIYPDVDTHKRYADNLHKQHPIVNGLDPITSVNEDIIASTTSPKGLKRKPSSEITGATGRSTVSLRDLRPETQKPSNKASSNPGSSSASSSQISLNSSKGAKNSSATSVEHQGSQSQLKMPSKTVGASRSEDDPIALRKQRRALREQGQALRGQKPKTSRAEKVMAQRKKDIEEWKSKLAAEETTLIGHEFDSPYSNQVNGKTVSAKKPQSLIDGSKDENAILRSLDQKYPPIFSKEYHFPEGHETRPALDERKIRKAQHKERIETEKAQREAAIATKKAQHEEALRTNRAQLVRYSPQLNSPPEKAYILRKKGYHIDPAALDKLEREARKAEYRANFVKKRQLIPYGKPSANPEQELLRLVLAKEAKEAQKAARRKQIKEAALEIRMKRTPGTFPTDY
jgi:hypothetical protein